MRQRGRAVVITQLQGPPMRCALWPQVPCRESKRSSKCHPKSSMECRTRAPCMPAGAKWVAMHVTGTLWKNGMTREGGTCQQGPGRAPPKEGSMRAGSSRIQRTPAMRWRRPISGPSSRMLRSRAAQHSMEKPTEGELTPFSFHTTFPVPQLVWCACHRHPKGTGHRHRSAGPQALLPAAACSFQGH